jgi:hypothetical protein
LCGVCEECKERAKAIVELLRSSEELAKKLNITPLQAFFLLPKRERLKAE